MQILLILERDTPKCAYLLRELHLISGDRNLPRFDFCILSSGNITTRLRMIEKTLTSIK